MLHYGMPDADYRAIEAVSQSTLRYIAQSPAHMRYRMLHPDTEGTDALRFGRAFHAWALEAIVPACAPVCDRRTKEGKATWEAFAADVGSEYLKPDEWHAAAEMLHALKGHRNAAKLLAAPGHAECVLQWTDAETGVACKARVDKYIPGVCLMDLKTTGDASPREFTRSVLRYNYHVQAAWYHDAIAAVTGQDVPYMIVAVEKDAPHGVAVAYPNAEAIVTGRQLYREWLRLWSECEKSGKWPGYSDDPIEIELPKWAVIPDIGDHPF